MQSSSSVSRFLQELQHRFHPAVLVMLRHHFTDEKTLERFLHSDLGRSYVAVNRDRQRAPTLLGALPVRLISERPSQLERKYWVVDPSRVRGMALTGTEKLARRQGRLVGHVQWFSAGPDAVRAVAQSYVFPEFVFECVVRREHVDAGWFPAILAHVGNESGRPRFACETVKDQLDLVFEDEHYPSFHARVVIPTDWAREFQY